MRSSGRVLFRLCAGSLVAAASLGCLGGEIEVEPTPPEGTGGAGGVRPGRASPRPLAIDVCGPGVERGLLPSRGVQIRRVSAFQAVEVPLVVFGEAVEQPGVDLVQSRDVLVRVFVSTRNERHLERRERRGHLTLHRAEGEPLVYEDVREIVGSSRSSELESSFNFYIPGTEFVGVQGFSVELWDVDVCADEVARRPVRVPEVGALPLRARATGPARVHIVPVRFDGDGSGRLPDVSEQHLEILASALAALFPVSHVELTVREPVGTSESDLSDILNQLLQLRSIEKPPPDVSYYGLVNPAVTMQEHCSLGCVAGVATFGAAGGGGAVGVGLGYRGVADGTFVHEMGHVYRLMHAPCGAATGTDPDYPYRGATLGVWGYDARTGSMIDPREQHRDFMSYCDPAWISDYNYQSLVDRFAIVNGLEGRDSVPLRQASSSPRLELDEWRAPSSRQPPSIAATPFGVFRRSTASATARSGTPLRAEPSQVYRTLRVDRSGRLAWGLPVEASAAPGDPVSAEALDPSGTVAARFDVYRQELSEGEGALYFVPQPEPGWHAVRVDGHALLPFAAEARVRPFAP